MITLDLHALNEMFMSTNEHGSSTSQSINPHIYLMRVWTSYGIWVCRRCKLFVDDARVLYEDNFMLGFPSHEFDIHFYCCIMCGGCMGSFHMFQLHPQTHLYICGLIFNHDEFLDTVQNKNKYYISVAHMDLMIKCSCVRNL